MERNYGCNKAKKLNFMLLKSSDDLGKRKRLLWKLIRPLVPHQTRWFFEGHSKLSGQLWFKERELIYHVVRTYKPFYCFEIGTWKGGGSTLFITQALFENRRGELHTVEINKNYYIEAKKKYQNYLVHLLPCINFYLGDYNRVYSDILSSIPMVNFLFLDGAEDALETLKQYQYFVPYLKRESILMVHDWFSEKTRLVKPFVENKEEWEIMKILKPPNSIGFVMAIRK
jgi:hypothetical protein